jgi:hypothetical protein
LVRFAGAAGQVEVLNDTTLGGSTAGMVSACSLL